MAVHRDRETTTRLLRLEGDPEDIVQQTCARGLAWLVDAAEGHGAS
jgi:hypothetical protein